MAHSKSPGYKSGSGNHWVECQVCGFEYREHKMKLRWDNLIVCEKDWESRHPQDFVRARQDRITPSGLINPASPCDGGDRAATQYDVIPPGTFCNGIDSPFYVDGGYWPADYVDDDQEDCDEGILIFENVDQDVQVYAIGAAVAAQSTAAVVSGTERAGPSADAFTLEQSSDFLLLETGPYLLQE